MFRLLLVLVAVGGCLNAGTTWSTPTGADSDADITGYVSFSLTGCDATSSPTCTLNIFITNTEANPTSASQLISGVEFQLLNAGTSLTTPGTLSSTISNGSGGAVSVLTGKNFTPSTTTTTPARWEFDDSGSSFSLDVFSGGAPKDMIIGPGPYTNANPSITGNHSPQLAGTVEFSITDFLGLTTSTVLSNVEFEYGTGPDLTSALTCTSGCSSALVSSNTGSGGATPEPFTMSLAGGALAALFLTRRRLFAGK